jgi:hypothetical protein
MLSRRSKFKETIRAFSHLRQYRQEQPQAPNSGLSTGLLLLRVWQSERLSHTYSDFLASSRYGSACKFFLSDIYASKDFNQRNHDIQYLYKIMSNILPDILLGLVRNAIELYKLTDVLDRDLWRALSQDLEVTEIITPQLYAEGYRVCDNYDQRLRQIDLIVEVGRQVDLGTKIPLVGTTLRVARGPARRAGWFEMHDFLERGFAAFKHMHGAKEFLEAIQEREISILEGIFAGEENPFHLTNTIGE